MTELYITWPDGEGRFSPGDSPVELGRASTASVPLTEVSVSRQHLSIRWDGSQWVVSDDSTHGTFDTSGVRLARLWVLTDDRTIRLGGTEGVEVSIRHERGTAVHHEQNAGSRTHLAPQPPAALRSQQPERAKLEPSSAAAERQPQRVASELFPADAPQPGPKAPLPDGDLFPDAPSEEPAVKPGPRSPSALSDAGSSMLAGTDGPMASPESMPQFRLEPGASGESGPSTSALPSFDAAPDLDLSSPIQGEGFDPANPTFGPATGDTRNVGPNTTIISDATLRLNVGGQDYSFLPGAEVTIGRDPACLVQLDEKHSLVSRRHLRATYEDGHWWIEDFSSKGTFVNQKRIKGRYKAEGAFIANLGDDDAGTPMRIITAGDHKVPKSRSMLLIAALAAIALLAVAAVAVLLITGNQAGPEPDLASAKKSTVVLFGLDGGQGSGFFVSDNLILTNQHVSVLSPQMLVGVSREADEPAQIEYATELVANHPFLDISVLRISNKASITDGEPTISSEPVGRIGLPPVEIGDSNDIVIGDAVFSTGFPGRLTITSTDEAGALRLPSVVATSGEAANFTIWPGCSNPAFSAFIPADSPPGVACSGSGDIRRGVLLSTFSSGQGASGSAVFRENRVVAVVYAGAADEDNASLNITTSAFGPWLEEIIASNP